MRKYKITIEVVDVPICDDEKIVNIINPEIWEINEAYAIFNEDGALMEESCESFSDAFEKLGIDLEKYYSNTL